MRLCEESKQDQQMKVFQYDHTKNIYVAKSNCFVTQFTKKERKKQFGKINFKNCKC